VQLVPGTETLDWDRLPGSGVIGITAAASTPEKSVQAVLDALAHRYRVQVEEVEAADETIEFKRLAVI
jgi:4-hydroxy-3-methylbut-2-enyl diphosphate reductase